MEVHAHTHTPRKKWTHYFWEFLMLFLAVFCGFLAEYQLEHMIERDRAKQYIQSLYEDLKEDTATMTARIKAVSEKIENLENIAVCHDIILKNPGATACMLALFYNSGRVHNFDLTDRTIRQLTNAGGFRLLKKQDADSIIKYERQYRGYKDNEATMLQYSIDNLRVSYDLLVNFNANYAYKQFKDSIPSSIPLFITNDRGVINKYFNDLFRYQQNLEIQNMLLQSLKARAIRNIIYFKNKYHLE